MSEKKNQERSHPVETPPLSRKEAIKLMSDQIEQCGFNNGHILMYRTWEKWLGETLEGFAVIELDPKHSNEKKQRYILSVDKTVDSKPAGDREFVADSLKASNVASWLVDKNAVLFHGAGAGESSS